MSLDLILHCIGLYKNVAVAFSADRFKGLKWHKKSPLNICQINYC